MFSWYKKQCLGILHTQIIEWFTQVHLTYQKKCQQKQYFNKYEKHFNTENLRFFATFRSFNLYQAIQRLPQVLWEGRYKREFLKSGAKSCNQQYVPDVKMDSEERAHPDKPATRKNWLSLATKHADYVKIQKFVQKQKEKTKSKNSQPKTSGCCEKAEKDRKC